MCPILLLTPASVTVNISINIQPTHTHIHMNFYSRPLFCMLDQSKEHAFVRNEYILVHYTFLDVEYYIQFVIEIGYYSYYVALI